MSRAGCIIPHVAACARFSFVVSAHFLFSTIFWCRTSELIQSEPILACATSSQTVWRGPPCVTHICAAHERASAERCKAPASAGPYASNGALRSVTAFAAHRAFLQTVWEDASFTQDSCPPPQISHAESTGTGNGFSSDEEAEPDL